MNYEKLPVKVQAPPAILQIKITAQKEEESILSNCVQWTGRMQTPQPQSSLLQKAM